VLVVQDVIINRDRAEAILHPAPASS